MKLTPSYNYVGTYGTYCQEFSYTTLLLYLSKTCTLYILRIAQEKTRSLKFFNEKHETRFRVERNQQSALCRALM